MNPSPPLQDMPQLHAMLHRTIGSDSAFLQSLRRPGSSPLQLLDLACGACHEAQTLAHFFSSLRDSPSSPPESVSPSQFHLTGLDLRRREIDHARTVTRTIARPASDLHFQFLHGDATRLHEHRELPEQFDVVFMRHQNLWHGERPWTEIFAQALEKLSPDGRLIITSYFDREHEQALAVLRNQGGLIVANARNPQSRALSTPGKSVDRHVAVIQRSP